MLKPQSNTVRRTVSLDGFWSYRRDPRGRGARAGWAAGFAAECELAVPGSWNEQRADLAHYFGRGWYQTRFAAPAEWAAGGVWLHVGCAQHTARVWLNGRPAGTHRGGSLPFECDLAPLLRCGADNLLVIEVDGSLDPWDLPPAVLKDGETRIGFHHSNPAVTYDFFPFAGLPRSVQLQVTPTPLRIETVEITTTGAKAGAATVAVLVRCTEGAAAGAEVSVELEGAVVRRKLAGKSPIRLSLPVARPRLWDLGRPELYRAVVSVSRGGRIVDSYVQTFGIRTIRVTRNQFLLNGRPVFFKGFGKHEDFAVAGRGLVPPVLVRDFDLMHWMGANSFRTSHYPYAEEWYEYADRHGILVIAETPLVGLTKRLYRSDILARAEKTLQAMIQRDRHHPSVVMWSLANEPDIDTAHGKAFFRSLIRQARAADPSRPITYVAHREPKDNAPLADCDVVCVNKYYGWYERPGEIAGSLAEFGACLDRFRAAFKKPVLLAEFGADAMAGLHARPAEMFSEEFQAEIIAAQYTEACRRPWLVGTHVWTFADFKTSQSITRITMNRKGIFTREREPKLAAHRLRELWQAARQQGV